MLGNKSYFANNNLLDAFPQEIDQQYSRSLLVCFLTIKDLRDFLFAPDTNLASGLSELFVNEVLLPDINNIIKTLEEYQGMDDRGVRQAQNFMELALKDLYVASTSYSSNASDITSRVDSLLSFRANIQDAYYQLEHLSAYGKDFRGHSVTSESRQTSSIKSFKSELSKTNINEPSAKSADSEIKQSFPSTPIKKGQKSDKPAAKKINQKSSITNKKVSSPKSSRSKTKKGSLDLSPESSLGQPAESGSGNKPPLPPTGTGQTEEPEPLPQRSDTESSDVIKPYTIAEDALDKHVATDKPIQNIKQDKLDFKIYVNALRSFILSKYTTTPITISIDGVWGTGKSSLMSMLKGKLDPQRDGVRKFFEWWWLLWSRIKWYLWFIFLSPARVYGKTLIALNVRTDGDDDNVHLYLFEKYPRIQKYFADIVRGFAIDPEVFNQPGNEIKDKWVAWWALVNARSEAMEPPYHYTVWLNAWKFDNQEEVWASLALATMEQIKQKHGLLWRLRFWLELTFSRVSFLEGLWQVAKQFILPLLFALVAAYYNVILGSFDVQLDAFKQYGSPLLVAGAIISGILSVSSIFKDPFQIPLDKVFDHPNYKDNVKFLSHFEKDFARIVRAATKNGFGWKRSKLVIFIDDLDRCEPPKSADIVEAVNLFLDAEGCVFVIGMDSESVARSIEVKYKDLFERIKAENTGVVSLGRLFLDKIVQIPFSVPRPTPGQITRMVEDSIGMSLRESWNTNVQKIESIKEDMAKMKAEDEQRIADKPQEVNVPPTTVEPIPNIAAPHIDPASYAKPEVQAAILAGTKLLADNPRQVKTFINLFRLSIYIANERKLLEEKIIGEKTSGLNLDKLAVWTACTVRWPGLVRHLYTETQIDSLCQFACDVSQAIVPEFRWQTGHKNIPAELKKKIDNLRKAEKGSEAHWCHLPWDWWLLEPDFLKAVKILESLWAPSTEKGSELNVLLSMSRPLSPTTSTEAK